MPRRKTLIPILVLVLLTFTVGAAYAGGSMTFKQKIIKNVPSGIGAGNWVTCASITVTPPKNGYVVVTASGMAEFDTDQSDLTLTLGKQPAAKGVWYYGLTPGYWWVQNFNVRQVFQVWGGTPVTFYLNGSSLHGPGNNISVQVGSMTAEFYAKGTVTLQSEPQVAEEPAEDQPKKDAYSNTH